MMAFRMRAEDKNRKNLKNRPYLGIYFKCCSVYQRIYLNQKGTAFVGWCPKCLGKVEIKVDPGGTNDRFFTAI